VTPASAQPAARGALAAAAAFAAAALLFAALMFGRLGHPLLWYDEAETAAFAQRVLAFGYPKVHDGRNTLYSLGPAWRAQGIGLHEPSDAYTGSPWLQYYVGAVGVALGAGSDDLYARTACVRLPFALAGAAGLALLLAACWPLLGPGRARRLGLAALYALLLCGSVSLQLHLREARHYPLGVLWTGLLVHVWLRRHVLGRVGYAGAALGTGAALLLLFHSFYPAAVALGAACALWLAGAALRRPGPPAARAAWLLREGAPLAAAALATAPLLGFFDFLAQARGWSAGYADAARAAANAQFLAGSLLRHEWLLPVLPLRLAAEWLARRDPGAGAALPAQRLAAARFLCLAIVCYAGVALAIPFLFERYFVALGPLSIGVLLLDLATTWEAARDAAGPARRAARAALALGAAALAAGSALRAPELAGRVAELRRPYRGPLDYVIPYLRERYPDPSRLVIATNYEDPAFVFYLGSRVTVGFYAADLERDLQLLPDVIVARPWPDQLEVLEALASRARYAERRFPVANLRWNQTPSLSAPIGAGRGHRFRDPVIGVDGPELVILERIGDPAAAPAPGSAPAAR
jgi:hypothetical protein